MKITLHYLFDKLRFLKANISTMIGLFIVCIMFTVGLDKYDNTDEISNVENLNYLEAKLFKIEKGKKGRYYNFYTESDKFKLAANYIECIEIETIQQEIKTGDVISLGYTNNTVDGFYDLVSLRKDDKEFISLDCVNKNIKTGKNFWYPFFLISIYIALIILVYNIILRLVNGFQKISQGKNK